MTQAEAVYCDYGDRDNQGKRSGEGRAALEGGICVSAILCGSARRSLHLCTNLFTNVEETTRVRPSPTILGIKFPFFMLARRFDDSR